MSGKKVFYVCSYGGSGSTMLCRALQKYGKTKHVHSRTPPDKLEYVGIGKKGENNSEWFNGIEIPESELENYHVIYIYRNPSFAIPSRFRIPLHLKNIQVDDSIKIHDILSSGKDLYNIREFYDNYTKPNNSRNYRIHCIKYEDIFDKQDEISELFGIGKLNMSYERTRKGSGKKLDKNSAKKLNDIYADLIDEMNTNDFIITI